MPTHTTATRRRPTSALLRATRADRHVSDIRRVAGREYERQAREALALLPAIGKIPLEVVERWETRMSRAKERLVPPLVFSGYKLARIETYEEVLPETGKAEVEVVIPGGARLVTWPDGIQEWVQPEAEEALVARRAQANIHEYIRQTSKLESATSAKRYSALMAAAVEQRWTPGEFRAKILANGLADGKARAELMARTMSIWGYNEGAMLSYQRDGFTVGEWFVSDDDALCPFCSRMRGQQMLLGQPYMEAGSSMQARSPSGGMLNLDMPLVVVHPPLHVRCRCTLLPVFLSGYRLPTAHDVMQESRMSWGPLLKGALEPPPDSPPGTWYLTPRLGKAPKPLKNMTPEERLDWRRAQKRNGTTRFHERREAERRGLKPVERTETPPKPPPVIVKPPPPPPPPIKPLPPPTDVVIPPNLRPWKSVARMTPEERAAWKKAQKKRGMDRFTAKRKAEKRGLKWREPENVEIWTPSGVTPPITPPITPPKPVKPVKPPPKPKPKLPKRDDFPDYKLTAQDSDKTAAVQELRGLGTNLNKKERSLLELLDPGYVSKKRFVVARTGDGRLVGGMRMTVDPAWQYVPVEVVTLDGRSAYILLKEAIKTADELNLDLHIVTGANGVTTKMLKELGFPQRIATGDFARLTAKLDDALKTKKSKLYAPKPVKSADEVSEALYKAIHGDKELEEIYKNVMALGSNQTRVGLDFEVQGLQRALNELNEQIKGMTVGSKEWLGAKKRQGLLLDDLLSKRKTLVELDRSSTTSATREKARELVRVRKDRRTSGIRRSASSTTNIKAKGPHNIVERFEAVEDELHKMIDKDVLRDRPYLIEMSDMHQRASYLLRHNSLGTVNCASNVSDGVIAHELGHHVEGWGKGVKRKAFNFLRYRAKAHGSGKVTEIYKGSGEWGYKDNFEQHYAGKVYTSTHGGLGNKTYDISMSRDFADLRSTELISMGVEAMFTNPERFAHNDKEFFKFILGVLRGKF